jgi:hypothetical protein
MEYPKRCDRGCGWNQLSPDSNELDACPGCPEGMLVLDEAAIERDHGVEYAA